VADASIRVPTRVGQGEVFVVKVIARHLMESGFRHDNMGRLVPRNVVREFVCEYGGQVVFRAELSSGISTNPYLMFPVRARASGELEFTWIDDLGTVIRAAAPIEVV
jgi:sulfur-oxidizing protein SoxZ